MFQQIQTQELTQAPLGQVTPQSLQAVMAAMMAIWAGAWVISQVIKVFKGEEIEKPPLVLGR